MQNGKPRHSFYIILTTLIVVIICLAAFLPAEYYLRTKAYYPGSFVWNFSAVDSLVLNREMITDLLGIQRANPAFYRDNPDLIAAGYIINDDGFRSEPFLPKYAREQNKPALLLLGDSHAWGASAEPVTRCFADSLRKAGYYVFNTGIPGADPAQYWAVAKQYVPALQPDYCILMFDGSNDFMWYWRKPVPYVPIDYWTNAGIITAWKSQYVRHDNHEYFPDAESAYRFFLKHYTLNHDSVSWTGKICRKTTLTTHLYKWLSGWKDISLQVEKSDTPYARIYIERIDSLCRTNKVPLLIFIIPGAADAGISAEAFRNRYPLLFADKVVFIPENLTRQDYNLEEYHLNNQGHAKMAAFILKILESQRPAPSAIFDAQNP